MRSSPKIHPTLHISRAVPYLSLPSKTSGDRYHIVTTFSVYGLPCPTIFLPSPKSQIFSYPLLLYRIFDVFKSLCMIFFFWRNSIPYSNCYTKLFTCDSSNSSWWFSITSFNSCSMYSIIMKIESKSVPITTRFTAAGGKG